MARPQRAKDTIDNAALTCFARKGVQGTSNSDIADAAGTTTAALYHFYRNKEDLVVSLFRRHYHALGADLAHAAAGETAFRDRLAAMIAVACRLHDTRPDVFTFLLLTQHDSLPRLEHDPENPVDVVQGVIAAAISANEVPEQDADAATAAVFGIVLQTATFHAYGRLSGHLTPRAGELTRACLGALNALGEEG